MATQPARIGILGGTFDPIHIGHLRAAIEVREQLALDQLRLIPSARPPHRDSPQVSAAQRLAMVELAIEGIAGLHADDRELRRAAPSWSIDTLESLRAENGPDAQLFLLLGWDAFCGLPGWQRWEELLLHCHLLVLQRPDADLEPPETLRDLIAARSGNPEALQGPGGQIGFFRQDPLAVSATRIRQLLTQGRSVRFLLPDSVNHYIHAHGLYRAPH
jgi:nicotinate-nucleotide adenylyltransferase